MTLYRYNITIIYHQYMWQLFVSLTGIIIFDGLRASGLTHNKYIYSYIIIII